MRKRALPIAVGAAILAWLWSTVGWAEVAGGLATLHGPTLALAFLLFVPQTLVSAWRWRVLAHPGPGGFARALQLVLAAGSLNVLLPSKLGDVAKGLVAARESGLPRTSGLALGVWEKALDTGALGLLLILATLFVPPDDAAGWAMTAVAAGVVGVAAPLALGLVRAPASWSRRGGAAAKIAGLFDRLGEIGRTLRGDGARWSLVIVASVFLWVLHLLQFAVVQLALGGEAQPLLVSSRVPMAIFVGLLPLTFAGLGTRDAAMLHFLGPRLGDGAALVLGLFATVRYVVVGLAGLPFLGRFRALVAREATR